MIGPFSSTGSVVIDHRYMYIYMSIIAPRIAVIVEEVRNDCSFS